MSYLVNYEKLTEEFLESATFDFSVGQLSNEEKKTLEKNLPRIPLYFLRHSKVLVSRRGDFNEGIEVLVQKDFWTICMVISAYVRGEENFGSICEIEWVWDIEKAPFSLAEDLTPGQPPNLLDRRFDFWWSLNLVGAGRKLSRENELEWAYETERLMALFYHEALLLSRENSLRDSTQKKIVNTIMRLATSLLGQDGLEGLQVALDEELER